MRCRNWVGGILVAAGVAACLALQGPSTAAELKSAKAQEYESVDVFDAIKDKQVEVKFIPKNDREAQILIKNVADRPLSVRMPEAFAGLPVLAQGLGGGGAAGGGGAGGGNQGTGGGLGGGGGGGQGGGAAFNIAPEKMVKVKVNIVCLDHGKADPNPRIPYELRPLDCYVSDPAIGESLKLMAAGEVSQRVAQIAAWHLNNHMSYEQLAAKEIKHLVGPSEPYFTTAEITQAVSLVQEAQKRADAAKAAEKAAPKTESKSASETTAK